MRQNLLLSQAGTHAEGKTGTQGGLVLQLVQPDRVGMVSGRLLLEGHLKLR